MLHGFPAYGGVLALAVLTGCGGRSGLDLPVSDASADASVRAHRTDARADHAVPDSGADRGRVPPVDAGHDAHSIDAARDAGPPDARTFRDASHAPDARTFPDASRPVDASPPVDACSTGCVPMTCAEQGIMGGPASDGCGGLIECGSCGCLWPGLPRSCIGAVTIPPQVWWDDDCCGSLMCTPSTCPELGVACGWVPDGCGDSVNCGACKADGTCPGGGRAGDCAPCVPRTCASAGLDCGASSDGCGGTIECGSCDPCVPCDDGVCAGTLVSLCVPQTCEELGTNCGPLSDQCGGLVECGECAAPASCIRGTCTLPCAS